MMKKISIGLILTALSCPCFAGELDVAVASFQKTNAIVATSVKATGLEVNKKTEGDGWKITFGEIPELSGELSVEILSVPVGYSTTPMIFEMPFYKSASRILKVGNALINQGGGLADVRSFIKSTRSLPKNIDSLVVYHQRAGFLWSNILNGIQNGGSASRDHVIIAYRLLLSSRALFEGFNLKIDPRTQSASVFLKGLLEDDSRRLLGKWTAPRSDVKALTDYIELRDTMMLERIVANLEVWVSASSRVEKRTIGCAQSTKADIFLNEELDLAERSKMDPLGEWALRVLNLQLECATRQLQKSLINETTVSPEYIKDATVLSRKAEIAFQAFEAKSRFPNVRLRVQSAGALLRNQLDELSR